MNEGLWLKIIKLSQESGHFSLCFDGKTQQWDASFIHAISESACAYGDTDEEAIIGAMKAYQLRKDRGELDAIKAKLSSQFLPEL